MQLYQKFFVILVCFTVVAWFLSCLISMGTAKKRTRDNISSDIRLVVILWVFGVFTFWSIGTAIFMVLLAGLLAFFTDMHLMPVISKHASLQFILTLMPSVLSWLTFLFWKVESDVIKHFGTINIIKKWRIVPRWGNWYRVQLDANDIKLYVNIHNQKIKDNLKDSGLDNFKLEFTIPHVNVREIYEKHISNSFLLGSRILYDFRETMDADLVKEHYINAFIEHKDEINKINLKDDQTILINKIFASFKLKMKIPLNPDVLQFSCSTPNGAHIFTVSTSNEL